MTTTKSRLILAGLFLITVFISFFLSRQRQLSNQNPNQPSSPAQNQSSSFESSATLVILAGHAQTSFDLQNWSQVDSQTEIVQGQTIKTQDNSQAALIFPDGSITRLDSNTQISLETLKNEDNQITINIFQSLGNTWHRIRKLLDPGSLYQVETSTTVATVRGTVFGVDTTQSTTQVFVEDSHDAKVEVAVFDTAKKKRLLSTTLLEKNQMVTVNPHTINQLKTKQISNLIPKSIPIQTRNRPWHRLNRLHDQRLNLYPTLDPKTTKLKPLIKQIHLQTLEYLATQSGDLTPQPSSSQVNPIFDANSPKTPPPPAPTPTSTPQPTTFYQQSNRLFLNDSHIKTNTPLQLAPTSSPTPPTIDTNPILNYQYIRPIQ